jgi:putative membrane protein
MISFLIRTAISAVALLVIAQLSNGQILVKNFVAALIAALIIGVANAVVKPILMAITGSMTCVLSCLTLGLWSLVLSCLINGLIFYMAGQNLVPGFAVKGFVPALGGALALAIVNSLATVLTRREPQRD